jgi:recombinational DNA repair protein RecR
MWTKQLTIAIVEKDLNKLSELMKNLPQLDKKEEIESAIHLIREAKALVQTLKDATEASMVQMKKSITFLKSTQEKIPPRFDVKS